ncbi:ADP-ribosyltransferase [Thermomonospora echinospora]|uniref:ADP-ribosyltransferase n=1 Tax=Thermomonospora echinospora TaxID=1992 RepID=UPI0013596966|nr:ADP-ribosyltransferase [Thermomonospora echinospora]
MSLVALVATVVVALTSAGLPGTVRDAAESALCPLKQDAGCEPGTDAGVVPARGAPVVAEPAHSSPAVPRPEHTFSAPDDSRKIIPSEDWDEPLQCWELLQGVCDLGQGAWIGAVDTVQGVNEGAGLFFCLTYICGGDRFDETRDTWGRLFTTNPLDTAQQIWDGATKDHVNDWNTGHGWRSVGRLLPDVLGAVFGGKGINRVDDLPSGPKRPERDGGGPSPRDRPGQDPAVPRDVPGQEAAVEALRGKARWGLLNGIPGAVQQAAEDAALILQEAQKRHPAGDPAIAAVEDRAQQVRRLSDLAARATTAGLTPSDFTLLKRYGIDLRLIRPGDPDWNPKLGTHYVEDTNTLEVHGAKPENDPRVIKRFLDTELPDLADQNLLWQQFPTDWEGYADWAKDAVRFPSDAAYRDWVVKNLTHRYPQLPEGPRDALDAYRYKEPYQEINGYLRGRRDASEQTRERIAAIDAAMDGSYLPVDMIVTRYVGTDAFDRPPAELKGSVQTDPGFMSTATTKRPHMWAHHFGTGKEYVSLYLRAPAGTRGIHLPEVVEGGRRAPGTDTELLLDRGQRYRIDEVVNEGGLWKVFGTILP